MKRVMMVAILLIASVLTFGQAKQVVNKTTSTTTINPIKIEYSKDKYTDEEFIFANYSLVVTKDKRQGLRITPDFSKVDGVWVYDGLTVKSFNIGSSCVENDKIHFLFEDGTKLTYESWQSFNCDNTSYFDRSKNMNPLKKRIKGIKFMNGRTFDSYELILTDPNDKNYFINVAQALQTYNKK